MAEPGRRIRFLLWLGVVVILASLTLLTQYEPTELGDPEPAAPPVAEDSPAQESRQPLQTAIPSAPSTAGEAADSRGEDAPGEVQGRIIDALGSPLAGCRVILDPREALRFTSQANGDQSALAEDRSDSAGNFQLLADGPGPWVLSVIHPDYPPTLIDSNLLLPPGRRIHLGDLQLHSEIGLVVMVRAEGGLPVPGALLNLDPVLENPELPNSTQRAMRRTALTDQSGRGLFYGVDAGPYLLRAEASGLASKLQHHSQKAGLARPPLVRVDLMRGEILRGRLRNAKGEPVVGAAIHLSGQDRSESASTSSGAGGLFRLTGLHRGRYSLRAEAPWLGVIEQDALQIPSSFGLVELQFPSRIEFSGQVLAAEDGVPCSAAVVTLIAPAEWTFASGAARSRQENCDARGIFRFDSVPAGRYRLQVASDGFFPTSTSIDIEESTQPIDLALRSAFELRGRMVDESGQGLSGGQVHVIDASYDGSQFAEFKLRALAQSQARPRFHSDPDGSFRSEALGAGRFRVRLSARGKADRLSRAFATKPGVSLDLGDLVLAPAARLQGRALLAMDAAAAQAVVCLDPLGESEPPRLSHQTRADAAGNFLFEGIEAGAYELFYYYPEEQRPSPAVDSHTRSLVRIHVRAGALERQDLVLR